MPRVAARHFGRSARHRWRLRDARGRRRRTTPLSQLAGIGLILFAVSRPGVSHTARAIRRLDGAMVALLVVVVIYKHASMRDSIFDQIMKQYPLLFLFALGGFAMWAATAHDPAGSNGVVLAAFALLLGTAHELPGAFAASRWRGISFRAR